MLRLWIHGLRVLMLSFSALLLHNCCGSVAFFLRRPHFVLTVCAALVEAGVFEESSPPNHVLLNEYSEGQGIGMDGAQ